MNTVVPFALAIMLGSLGASLLGHYARRARMAILTPRFLEPRWYNSILMGVLKSLEWFVR